MALSLLSPRGLLDLIASGRPAMIEFYSPVCPHCAALEPVLEEIAQEWGDRVAIAQVDVLENPRVAQDWTVMGTPTVIFFRNSAEVARLTGVQGKRQYERELKTITEE